MFWVVPVHDEQVTSSTYFCMQVVSNEDAWHRLNTMLMEMKLVSRGCSQTFMRTVCVACSWGFSPGGRNRRKGTVVSAAFFVLADHSESNWCTALVPPMRTGAANALQ